MSRCSDGEENIVVAVRVRPLNGQERASSGSGVWKADVLNGRLTLTMRDRFQGGTREYAFDKVFGMEASSEVVYDEVARPLVNSAVTGMNATLFAYGQTGSGKSYTMRYITRAAGKQFFHHIATTSHQQQFLIKMSAIEIYNEIVRDLLSAEDEPLRIQDDPQRGPVVEHLKEICLTSFSHFEALLEDIESRRHMLPQVAETRHNESSSRSHTIVRLYVECSALSESETDEGVVTSSTMNFVDLAGSERSSTSGLEEDDERLRMKEGCHINRSLLTLGTVIRCLSDPLGRKHIPYRDSRLTRILQPSLSGNARMAIICTISPARSAVETTRAALHFATYAKSVQMCPKVNKIQDSEAQLRQMMQETEKLKEQIKAYETGSAFEELNHKIQRKEQEILRTTQAKDGLQRRLGNLEKLVMTPVSGTPIKRRASFDDLAGIDGVPSTRGSPTGSTSKKDIVEELVAPRCASFDGNVWITSEEPRTVEGVPAKHSVTDYWIPPTVRKRLEHLDMSQYAMDTIEAADIEGNSTEWRLEEIQMARGGCRQKAALTELQDEVRCLKQETASQRTITPLSSPETKENNTEWILKETPTRESCKKPTSDAGHVLDTLEKKISTLILQKDCAEEGKEAKELNPIRRRSSAWFEISFFKQGRFSCSHIWSNGSLKLRASATFNRTKPSMQITQLAAAAAQTTQPPKNVETGQRDWTVSDDFTALRQCLLNHRSDLDRLSFQKQMLLNQVVKLEGKLEESLGRKKRIEIKNQRLFRDLERGFETNECMSNVMNTATSRETPSIRPPSSLFDLDLMDDRDSWGGTPTVESTMVKIVQLWEELHVSLRRRSRFFLAFRESELFYYETEYRRLLWEKSRLTNLSARDSASDNGCITKKARKRSAKRLESERRWLASQMQFMFTVQRRFELFRGWGIRLDGKERKLKLVRKLWSPETLRTPNGMERSSALVVELFGDEEALNSHALDLIFRSPSFGPP